MSDLGRDTVGVVGVLGISSGEEKSGGEGERGTSIG